MARCAGTTYIHNYALRITSRPSPYAILPLKGITRHLLAFSQILKSNIAVLRALDGGQQPHYICAMENEPTTSVLYNAACPVCNFEISHYAKYAGDNGLPIRFDDLNSDALAAWDLTADAAARRLYVAHKGALVSGIPAFIILWRQMPRYRWLAKVVNLPVIRQIATVLYDYVAAPIIYRWHLRRQASR